MDTVFIDERQDVQKKTFTKWINAHLSKTACPPVKDLFIDLRDGHKLLSLLEVLTNGKFKREKGRMRVHHINNINRALAVVQEFGLKLVNISSDDIVEGSPKLTLGLIWLIALSFDGQKLVNSRAVSGIERSLLTWVRQFTDQYNIRVVDFTSSWSDGAAFLAVIHENIPKFNMAEAMKLHPIARLKMAFDLANRHLQIDQLLDPEDVNTHRPDKKSILMYVMCLYHAIDSKKIELGSIQHLATHSSATGSMEEMQLLDEIETESVTMVSGSAVENTIREEEMMEMADVDLSHPGNITDLDEVTLEKVELKPNLKPMEMTFVHEESVVIPTASSQVLYDTKSRPASTATNFSVEIGGYQTAVEEVLAMILEAEEVLQRGYPDVDDISEVKEQFHKHEEFMQRLAEHQQFVGGALEEGRNLISGSNSSGGLNSEEQAEVHHQMLLLNERWEALRVRALEIQSKIHLRLAHIQTKKIDELRIFLTNTEDRISRMSEIATTLDAVKEQMTDICKLKADLEEQQKLVDSLSNLVIIVDDDSDNFADLEDRLSALGERWSHVVKWTTTRWDKLQEVNGKYIKMTEYYSILCQWMDGREADVKALEGNEVVEIGGIMKRMKDLQYCEQDITCFLIKLEELEGIVNALSPQEPMVESLVEKVEDLSDRCDALKQILEIQQTRIESMGFKVPSSEVGTVMPEGWVNYVLKFDVSVIDSATTIEDDLHHTPQSNKKRKLQRPEPLLKLDEQMSKMTDVLENMNYELRRSQMNLHELNEMTQKLQNFETDVKITRKMISNCAELDNLSVEKSKLIAMESRAVEISTRIASVRDVAQINEIKDKITDMKLILADNRDWYKQHANKATHDEIDAKLSEMDAFAVEIALIKETDVLRDDKELEADFTVFNESWVDLSNAINTLIREKFVDLRNDRDVTQLIREIDNVQIRISSLDAMHENVNAINALKLQYEAIEEKNIRTTNKDILEIWERIPQTINEKVIKQNTAIENVNHFNKEIISIRNQIATLTSKLNNDVFIFGEIKMLEAQRKEYDNVVTEIKKIEIDIISVKNFSEIITSDVHKLNEMATIVHELSIQHINLVAHYDKKCLDLEKHFKESEDMISRVRETELWLNDLEMNTPKVENSDIQNSNELFQIKSKFQVLKETCEKMTVKFRELNEEASEAILQIDDLIQTKTESKVSYLAVKFTKLNARWNDVTSLVYTRTALLEHVSAQLGEFRALIASETGYLDKLENLLRKTLEKAADAEEISEELDNLENYLRNHSDDRIDKIQDIGKELTDYGIIKTDVQADTDRIVERWTHFQHQAKQRAQLLEQAVSEAQSSESRVTKLQEWFYRVDLILSEHIKNDITMEDLPHDFQRLNEEFKTNEGILRDMKNQITTYKEMGIHAAATRLEGQLDFIEQNLFTSIQQKLEKLTSQPVRFESRLNRAMGELRNVERSSCILDVTTAGPASVEEQLQHCLKIYRTLSEVKPDIENVIKTGRKVCEDKTSKTSKVLTQKIDALKYLYNALGETITHTKVTLENLCTLKTTFEDNIVKIDAWVTQHTDVERHSYRDDFLSLKEVMDLFLKCDQLIEEYKQTCDETYLQDITERIDELKEKFSKISNRDAVKMLNEMKSTLQNLDTISLDTLRTMQEELKNIKITNTEVENLRAEVLDIIEENIKKPEKDNDDDHEIIILSDTVRQRRARTPSANGQGGEAQPKDTSQIVDQPSPPMYQQLPDLLPTTFHLAESSFLFSSISDKKSDTEILLTNRGDASRRQQSPPATSSSQTFAVHVRESNFTEKTKIENVHQKSDETVHTIQLECVGQFEPEHVETVMIYDASEDTSEGDTSCPNTPVFDERADVKKIVESDDDDESVELRENSELSDPIHIERQRISFDGGRRSYEKDHDLLHDSEVNMRDGPKILKIRPSLRDILMSEDRDSFYSSDKENYDDPVVFSDDEDVTRLSMEVTESQNQPQLPIRDTGRIETPNSQKPDNNEKHRSLNSYKTMTPIEQRVNDFEKTGKYMIKKLDATKEKIAMCDGDPGNNTVEHLRLSIAPDAATLISQGDSLVLETHGKHPDLSQRVTATQTVLRDRFRDIQHSRLSAQSLSKSQSDTTENKNVHKEKTINEKKFIPTTSNSPYLHKNQYSNINIDEITQKVLKRIRDLFEKRVDGSSEVELTRHIFEIRERQEELKLAIEVASQAVPSPQAKVIMESLDKAKNELSSHFDAAVVSLANINKNRMQTEGNNADSNVADKNENISVTDASPIRATSGEVARTAAQHHQRENSPHPEKFNGNYLRDSEPYTPGSFAAKSKAKFFASPASLPAASSSTLLLASFEKSVLQITDWLTLERDMIKSQRILIGDVDAIVMAIDKQKAIIRELDFKKPQLDELVHTAENLKTDSNRQQLQTKGSFPLSPCSPQLDNLRMCLKVSRLREHWDETSQQVLQRKSQLAAMLGDSQRYEAKRLELEAWLLRMEQKIERMGTIATTADILNTQQQEQKAYHSELHSYKHHIEIFNQLTQKILAVYPADDTTRIKRFTDAVNLRFTNLNNAAMSRGKMLHAAMQNLQSFDRKLDQFLGWLSDAESLCENAETELDRNPHVIKVRAQCKYIFVDY